jgi:hypothetical protein
MVHSGFWLLLSVGAETRVPVVMFLPEETETRRKQSTVADRFPGTRSSSLREGQSPAFCRPFHSGTSRTNWLWGRTMFVISVHSPEQKNRPIRQLVLCALVQNPYILGRGYNSQVFRETILFCWFAQHLVGGTQ